MGPDLNSPLGIENLVSILADMIPPKWCSITININFELINQTMLEVIEGIDQLEVLQSTEKEEDCRKIDKDKSENKKYKSKTKSSKSQKKVKS